VGAFGLFVGQGRRRAQCRRVAASSVKAKSTSKYGDFHVVAWQLVPRVESGKSEVDFPRALVKRARDSYLCVTAEFGAGDESGLHLGALVWGTRADFSVDDSLRRRCETKVVWTYGGGETVWK